MFIIICTLVFIDNRSYLGGSCSSVVDILLKQTLLPPVAAVVRRRVAQLIDPGRTQLLHRSIGPIHWEERHSLLVRIPVHRKGSDILLQCNGDPRVRDILGVSTVEVRVRNILAVDCGWDGKVVCISLVVVRLVEVECVASEDELRGQGVGTSDLIRVILSL